ncbi:MULTISPECIES: SAM-dependent methyltransferase [Kitasatospora]|uniref:SAM-dependent methyltransferase n=1 Tax=Kitasatospora cathayae TaxID=3004092 RepID=A0ABY7QDM8_9ACTN|nr:SAM-dependent methyltransferase [Kitasatospora sp. HUAS 3-15]WBP90869.1 SAM-dependent methyltransferase [Kitasatospora sp. HUAS 3-15]
MSRYDGVDLRLNVPHSARMYDYYLGGFTNFAADREAAGHVLASASWVREAARANRAFMHRSTRTLARAGIDQFLDIGTGIPTSPNLHEVAQSIRPRARVVYADNDPIVLTHAQALLTSSPEGRTAYVEADVTDPGGLLAAPGLHGTIDLTRPVALSLNALLHFVPDARGAYELVEFLKSVLAPGSALVMTHITPDFAPEEVSRIVGIYEAAGTALQARTRAEFARFFDGWTLLDPGVVPLPHWRPDPDEPPVPAADAAGYAAVALRP